MRNYLLKICIIIVFFLSGNAQPFSYKITPSKIEEKINTYLQNNFKNTTVIKFEIVNLKAPVNLFAQTQDHKIEISRNNTSLPRGNTIFILQVIDNNQIIKTSTIACKVKTWEQVFRAKKQISSSELVTNDDVQYDTLETTKLNSGYITDVNQIINNVSTKMIRSNDIFYKRNLKLKPVIQKGEKVNLVYEKGTLRISVQAKSMGEGVIGDYIYVKNLQSGKRLKALIIKPGEVQIK